jgi:hypothetical protein
MRHRLTSAILLLYPRRVRKGHGPEIGALIDDLIAHEGRSRTGLFIRLAVDGLVQRIASTATVWTVMMVLVATSFGALAASDFAAANAPQVVPRTVPTVAPAWHTYQTRNHPPQCHHTSHRWSGNKTTHVGAILTAMVDLIRCGLVPDHSAPTSAFAQSGASGRRAPHHRCRLPGVPRRAIALATKLSWIGLGTTAVA